MGQKKEAEERQRIDEELAECKFPVNGASRENESTPSIKDGTIDDVVPPEKATDCGLRDLVGDDLAGAQQAACEALRKLDAREQEQRSAMQQEAVEILRLALQDND